MNSADIIVLTGGIGLIIFILWFFFGSKGEAKGAKGSGSVQKIDIVVDGAYLPERVVVKRNLPVVMTFDRRDHGDCTEWVVFKDVPTKEGKEIKAHLSEGEKTEVGFTPIETGAYEFSCGMGMVRGKLIVKD